MQPRLGGLLDVIGAGTGFSPRTLKVHLPGEHIWGALSKDAQLFLRVAMDLPDLGGALNIGDLYRKRWADDTIAMGWYRELAADDKVDCIVFATLLLHEATHYFDFLGTPFGLNFYSKCMREYWNLQRLAPELLENQALIGAPLVDFDRIAEGVPPALFELWHDIRPQVLTLEALGDGGGKQPGRNDIAPGWGSVTAPFRLFGQELERVTVHDFLTTVRLPNELDWYLRPMTILETRAIANSLTWADYLLGGSDYVSLAQYFRVLYRREDIPPDYFMLFDLISRAFGFADFESLLESGKHEIRRQALLALTCACWYALQSPPPMNHTDSLFVSSAPARLLVILKTFEQVLQRGRGFNTFVELANAVDTSEVGKQLGFRPIDDILSHCDRVREALAQLNRQQTANPNVRVHFDRILASHGKLMAARAGYASWIGMPELGNPFHGLDDDAADLVDDWQSPNDVRDWVTVRDLLLFRYTKAQALVPRLEDHFGMPLLVIICPCGITTHSRVSRWTLNPSYTCRSCGRTESVDTAKVARISLE